MPTDNQGNHLTWKEWLERWKRGIEGITPLQQTNIQLRGTFIIILGLCAGIFITSLNFKGLWWLMLILIGGLVNTLVQLLGQWQKKKVLDRIYKPELIEIKDGKEKMGMSDMGIKIEKEVYNE